MFLLPCYLKAFKCWDSAPESWLVSIRKKVLDSIGIGDDVLSIIDASPVGRLQHEGGPWNVLDQMSSMTD